MASIRAARAKTRRYIVWYADSNGRGRTVTLPEGSNEKDALARQAELRGRKARGERMVPRKLTVGELLDEWFEQRKHGLKETTQTTYAISIKALKERIGRQRVSSFGVDEAAGLVAEMQRDGLKAWTIRGALTPLSRSFAYAQRKGWATTNPVRSLDRHERPKGDQGKMRILDRDEITKLLASCKTTRWRTLFATLVFTGMRISEALELRWSDVDLQAGLITVGDSKTEAGSGRRIVMMPGLGRRLRELKLESPHAADGDLVFCSAVGTTLGRRHTLRALRRAVEAAGIAHTTQHELRHTFASLLIGEGLDVTFVADQLGHANPQITLRTYAKLFDPARRRDEARQKLEASFGSLAAGC